MMTGVLSGLCSGLKKQRFKNMAVHTPKAPDEAETVDHRDCQLITCPMIQNSEYQELSATRN